MRVGVITTSYPRAAGDPAGHFVESHVRALEAIGHSVEVIAAGPPTPGVTRLRAGALFYTGGAPDHLERTPRALVDAARFAARLAVTVAARARRWDAIVAHWLAPSALAALPTRAPLLAIAHGGDIHTLRRLRLLGPALQLLRWRGCELCFVTRELREVARAAAPHLGAWLDRARIQPMGLDTARFAALPRTPTMPPTIFIAARLVPIKGIDTALAAFAALAPRAHLVIAGDGPERAALERRAPPGVTFLGAIDTYERDRWLARASLVLIPSRTTATGRTEGTPLAALEALAAGVPVVASNTGGLRELAPHLTLVPPDDPRALGMAIGAALDAPITPATHRAAVADLDWAVVGPRLLPGSGPTPFVRACVTPDAK